MERCIQYILNYSYRKTNGFLLIELMVGLLLAMVGTYYAATWYGTISNRLHHTRVARSMLLHAIAYMEGGNGTLLDSDVRSETVAVPSSVVIAGTRVYVPESFSVKRVIVAHKDTGHTVSLERGEITV